MFSGWDIKWPIPGSQLQQWAIQLDIYFLLMLKPGSDPKDCRIRQWQRGRVLWPSEHVDEQYSTWTPDPADPKLSPYIWDGGPKFNYNDGQWIGRAAVFHDRPGIPAMRRDQFPVSWTGYWSTPTDPETFYDFVTEVYDKSRGEAPLGPKLVAYVKWGMWFVAMTPETLRKSYYVDWGNTTN